MHDSTNPISAHGQAVANRWTQAAIAGITRSRPARRQARRTFTWT